MSEQDIVLVTLGVEEGVSHVTMPNLPTANIRNIESISTIRADEPKVNRRGCLQLHFKKLLPYIRKSPVIAVICISEALAD